MKSYKIGLCWVRRDLRLQDHTALSEACKNCDEVVIAFVFDSIILDKLKDPADRRLVFIHDALKEMDEGLEKYKSRLVICQGDPVAEIQALAKKLKVNAVFTNEDYESYGNKRDQQVSKKLKSQGVEFHSYKDQVIFSGGEVLKDDGTPYQVFTPYKKTWLKKFSKDDASERRTDLNSLVESDRLNGYGLSGLKNLEDYGFQRAEVLLPTGRNGGLKILRMFESKLKDYDDRRDFPAEKGTSKLSAHLRFGTISIREAVRFCYGTKNKGAQTWLSELIWREFYFMILDQYPHVEKQAFKKQYSDIKWPGKDSHFKAWCEGRTGFPIVDAGMRQLNETGYMHNRLRMITASFLVKDLLVDWRKGEAYFAEKLLDFDLAANNGGWQWSASTGCDAQPYFRIFNPESQLKRFDPDGEFLKQWVPEYYDEDKDYPEPIVNHKVQRQRALDLFKAAKESK